MLFSLQLHKRLRKPKEGFISCITHQRCSTKHGLRIGTNVRTRVNAGTQENFLVDVKVVPSWLVIAIPFMGQTTHQDILWIGHKLIRHGTVTSIEADLKIFYISLWRLIDWLVFNMETSTGNIDSKFRFQEQRYTYISCIARFSFGVIKMTDPVHVFIVEHYVSLLLICHYNQLKGVDL